MSHFTSMSPREIVFVLFFLGLVLAVYGLEVFLFAEYVLNLVRRKPHSKVLLTKRAMVLHILGVAGVICLLYGHFVEPHWIDVNRMTLTTARLKTASFRIVQISDLHYDIHARNEEKMIRLINDLRPDVIVATGDYLNDTRVVPRLKETLRRLNAPLGKFAVGCSAEVCRDVGLGVFAPTGFHLLYESGVTVTKGEDTINIWGLSYEGPGVCRALLGKVPASAFNVFLVHTPDLVEEVSGLGIDLYLCGHTHGGQVRLPLYGALVTHSKFGKKYESGLYRVGETTLYVNRGLGMEPRWWAQIRFLARPEIAVFDILPESRARP
jgi:predicted MPP superfamily phosphohydrolase